MIRLRTMLARPTTDEVVWASAEELRNLSEKSGKCVALKSSRTSWTGLHKVYEERSEEKRRLHEDFLVDEIREPWRSW